MAHYSQGLNGSDVDFDTLWKVLSRAFTEIHSKNASQLSFEELYRNAYKIVLMKKGGELYSRVAQFEADWLSDRVKKSIVKQLTVPLQTLTDGSATSLSSSAERKAAGESFLRALKHAWEDHQVCMGMLTDVLMYMVSLTRGTGTQASETDTAKDRVYCTDHRQPSIFAKSMGLFRDQILKSPAGVNEPQMIEFLTTIILDQIRMNRDGEGIDQHLIKANISMLEGLYESDLEAEDEKLYLQMFEPVFLQTSAVFFRDEGERLLRESDAGTYCKEAMRHLNEEGDRCRSTLSESTMNNIQKTVEDQLIRHKMKGLIEMDSGVKYMVDNDKFSDLALIYELEARVDARKSELTKALQEIIKEMGSAINNATLAASQAPPAAAAEGEEGDDKSKASGVKQTNLHTIAALKWVEDMLTLKGRFDTIWKTSFGSDQTISTALARTMAEVINACDRSSEYISLFIDENMKKGIKDKTEAEIDVTLEQAITTLRYVQDKDVFETYYKKHLCKRLILEKSVSIDVEKQMISRMKMELGNSFTLKLEAMFKDMTLSEELTSGYRDYAANTNSAEPKRVELSIKVLTAMTWPLEAFRSGSEEAREGRTQVLFPASMERIKASFEHFYANKHNGRKLTWQTGLGHADIKATFPKSRNGRPATHEINCSTHAMLILLLFNDLPGNQSLTVEEIQAQTNIPENDLKRNLQSLAVAPKTRFLVKEPMSREINPGDRFSFNENFSSKIIKIRVGVITAGNKVENDKERKETEKKNDTDRGYVIDAAVVRIMK